MSTTKDKKLCVINIRHNWLTLSAQENWYTELTPQDVRILGLPTTFYCKDIDSDTELEYVCLNIWPPFQLEISYLCTGEDNGRPYQWLCQPTDEEREIILKHVSFPAFENDNTDNKAPKMIKRQFQLDWKETDDGWSTEIWCGQELEIFEPEPLREDGWTTMLNRIKLMLCADGEVKITNRYSKWQKGNWRDKEKEEECEPSEEQRTIIMRHINVPVLCTAKEIDEICSMK